MAKSYKYSRSRKPITLKKLKLRMTDAIKELERIILDGDDDYQKIQAANAMSGLVNRYSKLLETTELEERLAALEEKLEDSE